MAIFDPNLTQRIKAKVRIVPDWRTRLKDYSSWGIGIALFWETVIVAIWGEYIPPDVRAIVTKVSLTFAAIGKFVIQGNVPGMNPDQPKEKS